MGSWKRSVARRERQESSGIARQSACAVRTARPSMLRCYAIITSNEAMDLAHFALRHDSKWMSALDKESMFGDFRSSQSWDKKEDFTSRGSGSLKEIPLFKGGREDVLGQVVEVSSREPGSSLRIELRLEPMRNVVGDYDTYVYSERCPGEPNIEVRVHFGAPTHVQQWEDLSRMTSAVAYDCRYYATIRFHTPPSEDVMTQARDMATQVLKAAAHSMTYAAEREYASGLQCSKLALAMYAGMRNELDSTSHVWADSRELAHAKLSQRLDTFQSPKEIPVKVTPSKPVTVPGQGDW